jgi:hypothetical protein
MPLSCKVIDLLSWLSSPPLVLFFIELLRLDLAMVLFTTTYLSLRMREGEAGASSSFHG